MIPSGDRGESAGESQARFEQLGGSLGPPEPIVDHRRTAYPRLRRVIAEHLRDVGDFVAFGQPDAARRALHMALAVSGEIEITPEEPT